MLGQRREMARLQGDFYRDQFRKMLRWLLGVVLIMFILIGIVIYLVLKQPTSHHYANTTEGKILPMQML